MNLLPLSSSASAQERSEKNGIPSFLILDVKFQSWKWTKFFIKITFSPKKVYLTWI